MSQAISAEDSSCCSCAPFMEDACSAIVEFVQTVLQNLCLLFAGRWEATLWHQDNKERFKAFSPFFFSSPPELSSEPIFQERLGELEAAYQQLENVTLSEYYQTINQKLANGFCHGECISLVKAAQDKSLPVHEILEGVSPIEVTVQQVAELFRASFQKHKRADLLDKLDSFLPQGFLGEVSYEVGQDVIVERLITDLQSHPAAYVIIRLYTATVGHTLVLDIDAAAGRFGFYNSSHAGYYEYDDLTQFAHALTSHVAARSDFLQKNARWDLDFYSRS